MLFKMDIVICKISRPLETLKQHVDGEGFEIFQGKNGTWKSNVKLRLIFTGN